jgi:hypothetical protein
MSAPIHNRDKFEDLLEALELYAPPWAREAPSAPAAPKRATPRPAVSEPAAPMPPKVPEATDAPTIATDDVAASPSPSIWSEGREDEVEEDEAPPTAPEPQIAEPQIAAPQIPERVAARPAPRMPQGVGGPNLDWRAPRADWPSALSTPASFEGDIAVKALRTRLSLDRQQRPEPPMRPRERSVLPFISRLSLVLMVAGVVAAGAAFVPMPEWRSISLKPQRDPVATTEPSRATQPETAHPNVRLVIEGRQAFANEPLPLGIALNGGTGGEFALLTGLATGTRLSAGSAFGVTGWRLPARELVTAFAYAPRDFVGVMDAAIDLRTSRDALVDRNVMRLEWIGKQPALRLKEAPPEPTTAAPPPAAPAPAPRVVPVVQSIDPEELATLLKRGLDYLQSGDIAASRLMLRRAANAGHAQAALALGATFDPYVFSELGVLGFAPDPAQARSWYERAGQLGAPEAARRIERLARFGR